MDLSSELVPSPATKAYTSFLDTVAANEVGPEAPHPRHGLRLDAVFGCSAHCARHWLFQMRPCASPVGASMCAIRPQYHCRPKMPRCSSLCGLCQCTGI